MEFKIENPKFGDQIRVNRGLYYHYGIYISNDEVIHFASLIPGYETSPEHASVCNTSLDIFLKGGILECANYSKEEMDKKRTPNEIVEYAKSKIGEKGYDLLKNNCEHFSNECVFGYKKSSQVDNVLSLLQSFFR